MGRKGPGSAYRGPNVPTFGYIGAVWRLSWGRIGVALHSTGRLHPGRSGANGGLPAVLNLAPQELFCFSSRDDIREPILTRSADHINAGFLNSA